MNRFRKVEPKEGRVYSEIAGKTVPIIDRDARYEIKNVTFGPIQIPLKHVTQQELQPVTLKSRESLTIEGGQFTDYIWRIEARRPRLIKIKVLPPIIED